MESFRSENQIIHISSKVEVSHLDIDTAIPIGLTITELVTNAKKHAFEYRQSGKIEIWLGVNDANQLCLEVRDNGVGGPNTLVDNESKSFGMNLIKILSKKLKGTITVDRTDGYSTKIVYDRYTQYSDPI